MLKQNSHREGEAAMLRRPVLIKAPVVAALRGQLTEEVYDALYSGRMRWVFNLATDPLGMIPDFRFWVREVAKEDVKHLPIKEVIGEILGWQEVIYSGQLCQAFSISRPTLKNLRSQLGGKLVPGGAVFQRARVEQFLNGRLMFPYRNN